MWLGNQKQYPYNLYIDIQFSLFFKSEWFLMVSNSVVFFFRVGKVFHNVQGRKMYTIVLCFQDSSYEFLDRGKM